MAGPPYAGQVPPAVRLDLWTVTPSRVPAALLRMGWDRRPRHRPGLRFAKLVGTGDGRTFTARDADPLRWGLLTVWDTAERATAFDDDPTPRGWARISTEHLVAHLDPVAARGRWSGVEPFGTPAAEPAAAPVAGPVASLTRARIRPSHWRRFWRAVPPVSADLHRVPGLSLAVGIGEAPVGLQGTFSVWRDTRSLNGFAYRRAEHRAVVARTPVEGWYSEELFARFAVRAISGSFAGTSFDLAEPTLPADHVAGPVAGPVAGRAAGTAA